MAYRRTPILALHQFIGGLLGVGIWSLAGAFVLRLADRVVERRDDPFLYVVAFSVTLYVNLIIYAVIWGAVGLVGALAGSDETTVAAAVSMALVGFLIQAKALGRQLDLAFSKACAVSLVTFLVTILAGLLAIRVLDVEELDGAVRSALGAAG